MEALEAIMQRKSVKQYTSEQLSDSELEAIVNAGACPPCAGVFHMSVIQNKELLQALNDAAKNGMKDSGDDFMVQRVSLPGYEPVYGAPTVIVLSAPKDSPYKAHNTSCAAENMIIAATAMGLASCYVVSTKMAFAAEPSLMEKCGIPEGYEFVCAVLLGHRGGDAFTAPKKEKATINYVK